MELHQTGLGSNAIVQANQKELGDQSASEEFFELSWDREHFLDSKASLTY